MTTYNKFSDLYEAIAKILPSASFGEDNEGQILIYTDLALNDNDSIVPLSALDASEGA